MTAPIGARTAMMKDNKNRPSVWNKDNNGYWDEDNYPYGIHFWVYIDITEHYEGRWHGLHFQGLSGASPYHFYGSPERETGHIKETFSLSKDGKAVIAKRLRYIGDAKRIEDVAEDEPEQSRSLHISHHWCWIDELDTPVYGASEIGVPPFRPLWRCGEYPDEGYVS